MHSRRACGRRRLDILRALGRFGAGVIEKGPEIEGDFAIEINGVALGLTILPDGVTVSKEPSERPAQSLLTAHPRAPDQS